MKRIKQDFGSAIKIYKFLLEKGFPQKAILKLVGDRFKLSSQERTILYRGITTEENLAYRKTKLVPAKVIKNNIIHIDGYNVFITIGSYLNGSLVFIGNDNYLRDAAEVHGKIVRKELINRAIKLTFEYLKKYKIKEIKIYLDKPVSKSGILAEKINGYIDDFGLSGKASTAASPDYILKNAKRGIIATSDSSIIDNSNLAVLDLARKVLTYNFKPKFLSLTFRL